MSRRGRYERRRGGRGQPFIMLRLDLVDSAAWRALDTVARSLYLEIKRRYSGSNNGRIGLGVREAAAALGVSTATAARAFLRLRTAGLIEATTTAELSGTGRKATEWLLTEHEDDVTGRAASNAWKLQKNSSPVSPQIRSVSPQIRNAVPVAQKSPLRLTTDTQTAISADFASHHKHTYIYSHRQGAAEEAEPAVVPTIDEAV